MKKFIVSILFLAVFFGVIQAKKNEIALDFKVNDIYGNEHHLSTYLTQGKFVYLQFFSTGCGTCQTESPMVSEVYRNFGCNTGNVIFIGIDYGAGNDAVKSFCQTYQMQFPAASGQQGGGHSIFTLYGVAYTPYSFLISPDGTILQEDFIYTTAQELQNQIVNYGGVLQTCQGTDFIYFSLLPEFNPNLTSEIMGKFSDNTITLDVPGNIDLTSIKSTFLNSTNSNVFIDNVLQISNETQNDFSLLLIQYSIIAENNAFSQNWNININKISNVSEISNNFEILPNPSKGILNFKNNDLIDEIEILDSFGNLVKYISKLELKSSIDISKLPNGIYYLKIKSNKSFYTKKLVLSK